MTSADALRALTRVDEEQHRRLTAWLTRVVQQECHEFAEYVHGPLRVVEPSVRVYLIPDSWEPAREVSLGGIEWDLHLPGAKGPRYLSVKHWPPRALWLWAGFGRWDATVCYTRFSLAVEPAQRLARVLLDCLQELNREAVPQYAQRDRNIAS